MIIFYCFSLTIWSFPFFIYILRQHQFLFHCKFLWQYFIFFHINQNFHLVCFYHVITRLIFFSSLHVFLNFCLFLTSPLLCFVKWVMLWNKFMNYLCTRNLFHQFYFILLFMLLKFDCCISAAVTQSILLDIGITLSAALVTLSWRKPNFCIDQPISDLSSI